MSLKSSDSRENLVLPVTNPPRDQDKLFNGSAMTKRGAYAAISYMSCAGTFIFFVFPYACFTILEIRYPPCFLELSLVSSIDYR